jgi:non-specific serine/threonine protein kinase
VVGGGLGDATRGAFVYDPRADSWARAADMPFRRTAGGAAVLGDRIIVVGGIGDSPAATMVFDPRANGWTAGPPLPAPREHLAVVGLGNGVYVIGGRWQDDLKSTNESLGSLDGSWRQLAPLPTARGGTAGGFVDGKIVVAGGEAFNPTRTFPQVEVYEPSSNTWRRAPDLPTPRHGLSVQGIGSTLFVIGGGPTAGLSVSPQNETLDLQ